MRPRLHDVFTVKEYRFLDVYGMRLHENGENDSINTDGLESGVYQKRNETVFMYTRKTRKRYSRLETVM